LNNVTASPKPVFEACVNASTARWAANARVIADLVPELEWLDGPARARPGGAHAMAYNRLKPEAGSSSCGR